MMLLLPALLFPNSTVMGARRIAPVSRHDLKFWMRKCVSILVSYYGLRYQMNGPNEAALGGIAPPWSPSVYRCAGFGRITRPSEGGQLRSGPLGLRPRNALPSWNSHSTRLRGRCLAGGPLDGKSPNNGLPRKSLKKGLPCERVS